MNNIPKDLLEGLNQLADFDENAFIEAHQAKHSVTSIRLNPFKPVDLDFELGEKVMWAQGAFYLYERPSFTHDPLFHAGAYYVQEAGSMFIEYALKQKVDFNTKLKVLDVCAAPGGKSTAINSLLNQESILVSNELNKSRADVLAYNLSKWGTFNTIVTCGEVHKFNHLKNFFDVLIVDAPCSGSGLFRKQPEAILEWSPEHVISCGIRQKKILEEILPSLADNGVLFYSTCSYSPEENEEIVNWLINEHQLSYEKLQIPANYGIQENELGYRFYPHLTKSEGFFCAVLRKKNQSEIPAKPTKKNISLPIVKKRDWIGSYVSDHNLPVFELQNRFHMSNQAVYDFMNMPQKNMYYRKVGMAMGEVKGKDFIPDHELALFTNLNPKIASVYLNQTEALLFLKKLNFDLPNAKQGLTHIKYKNWGIGWAKLLQNRMNNYLPNTYKILK